MAMGGADERPEPEVATTVDDQELGPPPRQLGIEGAGGQARLAAEGGKPPQPGADSPVAIGEHGQIGWGIADPGSERGLTRDIAVVGKGKDRDRPAGVYEAEGEVAEAGGGSGALREGKVSRENDMWFAHRVAQEARHQPKIVLSIN